MVALGNIFLLLPATVFASINTQDSSTLLDLDTTSFQTLNSSTDLSYILFTTPGCSECDTVHALLTELRDSNTIIGTVSCHQEAKICDDAGVFDVPTLMLSTGNGELVKYRDGWNPDRLRHYLIRQSGPAIVTLTNSTYNDFVASTTTSIVAFVTANDEVSRGGFETIAEKWRRHYSFGLVSDSTQNKKSFLSISRPHLQEPDLLQGPFSAEEIEAFLLPTTIPVLQDFDYPVHVESIASGKPLAYIIHNGPEDKDLLAAQLTPFAKSLQEKMNFVLVNSFSYPDMPGKSNLPKDRKRGFAIEDVRNTRKYPLTGSESMSLETIEEFVEKFLEGTVEAVIKSEEVGEESEDERDGLTTLVGRNFDAFAFNASRDVLVQFSVPWCDYCVELDDQLRTLGSIFNTHDLGDRFAVAKINVDANDVPVRVEGYPTLAVFPAGGSERDVKIFEGDFIEMLSVERLAAFVQESGKHDVDLVGLVKKAGVEASSPSVGGGSQGDEKAGRVEEEHNEL